MSQTTGTEFPEQNYSPFSKSKPPEVDLTSPEPLEMLKKVSDSSQKLTPEQARAAKKRYLASHSKTLRRDEVALNKIGTSSSKYHPGEVGTDDFDTTVDIPDEPEALEGFHKQRLATEAEYTERKAKQEETGYPAEVRDDDENSLIPVNSSITEADIPPSDQNIKDLEPKDDRTLVDSGPNRYGGRIQPNTTTLSRADILSESKQPKINYDPIDSEMALEPGWPEQIAEEEERKKGHRPY